MADTALVTGAAGHTGIFMVRYLKDKGYNIIGTDLKKVDRDKIFMGGKMTTDDEEIEELFSDLIYIPSDLTDKESLKPLFDYDIDVVFSIASLYDYFAEIDKLRKINVEGVRNLTELVLEKSSIKHFIHWSTCGVYGQPKYKKKKGWILPSDENAPYNPPNAYSVSKMEQEQMLFKLHEENGLPLTILRPAPIYGPQQSYGTWNIFKLIHKVGTFIIISVYPRKNRLRMPMVMLKILLELLFIFMSINPKKR